MARGRCWIYGGCCRRSGGTRDPSNHGAPDGDGGTAMNWLIPSALGIAGIAAIVAVALHFIARSRPLAETLPTARFVPDRPIYARTRSFALTDFPLLALRLAAIAAI